MLFDLVQTINPLGEECARVFAKGALRALQYVHSQNYCHRDIKLENILIDANLNVKLADLGFAAKMDRLLRTKAGTPTYIAPEIEAGVEGYNGMKADIFSLGVTMFAIVNNSFPFETASEADPFYKYILQGNPDGYFVATDASSNSAEFKDLFLRMVSRDPAHRPTADEALAHPWFNIPNVKSDDELKKEMADKINAVNDMKNERKKQRSAEREGGPRNYRGDDDDEGVEAEDYEKAFEFDNNTTWATLLSTADFLEYLQQQAEAEELGETQFDEENRKFYL